VGPNGTQGFILDPLMDSKSKHNGLMHGNEFNMVLSVFIHGFTHEFELGPYIDF
jgi:hypothetical protein